MDLVREVVGHGSSVMGWALGGSSGAGFRRVSRGLGLSGLGSSGFVGFVGTTTMKRTRPQQRITYMPQSLWHQVFGYKGSSKNKEPGKKKE